MSAVNKANNNPNRKSKLSHFILRFQNFIFTALLLVAIGLLAWLGKTYHSEIDLTQNQQNSLHPSTQKLLKTLDKPLLFVAYISDDAKLHNALKKHVSKFKKHKANTRLEIVNPELNPERAKADGIQYTGQLFVKLGDKSEVVESIGEQTIINVLQRLSREKPRLVIFLEGHGERNPFDNKSSGMSKLAALLEPQGFKIQPHNIIRTQSIPRDTSFIVIAAPQKEYLEDEVKIISDYIKQGGNVLWMQEPGGLFGLDNIEQQLGIIIDEGTMVDADQQRQKMLGIKHPAALAIIDYGDSPITQNLKAHTVFPFATAVSKESVENKKSWTIKPLLSTLATSWLESGSLQGDVKFDDGADKAGPLDIGLTLTRPDDNKKEQRIVVIGDSNFLLNNFIGQASNLELSTNIFSWLGEDDKLLSITPVKAPNTEIDLPDWALYTISIFLLLILPIALIAIGMLRWMRRRKR